MTTGLGPRQAARGLSGIGVPASVPRSYVPTQGLACALETSASNCFCSSTHKLPLSAVKAGECTAFSPRAFCWGLSAAAGFLNGKSC